MNILPDDIISHIGEFVIDEDTTCYTIHKYMFINAKIGKIFGRKYLEFIENTKKTSDINYKIIRFIHKKSVKYNPVYKQLENDMVKLQLPQIIFENKTARERHVIYMYAIYYGYIWYDESYDTQIICTYRERLTKNTVDLPELIDLDSYSLEELKARGIYHEPLFNRIGKNVYKWKTREECNCDFCWQVYHYIRTIKTLKLVKI